MGESITYRIIKQRAVPAIAIRKLVGNEKCYIGVSLNNPFFYGKHLPLLFKWIAGHFQECIIIIGDHLNRINETILHGKQGEDAIADSLKKGDFLIERIKEAISELDTKKFTIFRWADYIALYPEIFEEKKKLIQYAKIDAELGNAINESSIEFITRLANRNEPMFVSAAEAMICSKEYILEEMAVFTKIIEMGYVVQVYPGTQLEILKKMARGDFPQIQSSLKRGIYIDLTVKKRK